MAIPISIPNSEEVEDSYRSLDILLEQLLITLRQVLMQRRREAAASMPLHNIRFRHTNERTTPRVTTVEESSENSTSSSVLPLPDLVLDVSPDCTFQETRQRRNKQDRSLEIDRTSETTTTRRPTRTTTTSPSTASNWVQVGAELRRIADQFRATNNLDQGESEDKDSRMKDASLLSLLCPPLGGSVWTTVALLVGWGLLSRTR